MEFVYFEDKLTARAPNLIGPLLIKNTDQWAQHGAIHEALQRGENVTIRQPTEQERAFAEEVVVIYELTQELALRRQFAFAQASDYAQGVRPDVAEQRLSEIKRSFQGEA